MFVEKTLRRKEKRVEKRKASKRGRVAKIEGEKRKFARRTKKTFPKSQLCTRAQPLVLFETLGTAIFWGVGWSVVENPFSVYSFVTFFFFDIHSMIHKKLLMLCR